MNAVPPPPSLGGAGYGASGSQFQGQQQHHHQHAHGQGFPSMPHSSGGGSQKERSLRSIFVGNIPYEATEEQLVEIFREVGPVVSFRLVLDKETQRPKGYGFCEYQDSETAASAVRNLAARELHGRTLRVDSSANAKMQQRGEDDPAAVAAQAERLPVTQVESVDPEDAPKVIAKAVDALPARHVFDILTQLKRTAHHYPEEAHQMLASHPHVAYAALLAQVALGYVDPDIAEGLIHPTRAPVPILRPLAQTPMATTSTATSSQNSTPSAQRVNSAGSSRSQAAPPAHAYSPSKLQSPIQSSGGGYGHDRSPGVLYGRPPPGLSGSASGPPPSQHSPGIRGDRGGGGGGGTNGGFGPRGPRGSSTSGSVGRSPTPTAAQLSSLQLSLPGGALPGSEKEKAELVMQVLNLSDQDLKLLTPEQQESVRLLKQQVSSAIK
ncbi:cleavage stimulation factor subunit 2-like [Sycon ciliatum]|uniref:cleavage stimulation factor subunit 2-like n=1 Tax=Sycon ciliatum TaxID=27933 RepID=UPI0020ADFCF8|eukprot:scpid66170/ scgid6920/ Cleavage stimulation factor subunit 2; CF-1 64 kDa subunit; Cleavage stimulation factor 64 kDa subunit